MEGLQKVRLFQGMFSSYECLYVTVRMIVVTVVQFLNINMITVAVKFAFVSVKEPNSGIWISVNMSYTKIPRLRNDAYAVSLSEL